jgi:polysaccharide biosynthesis transport protein
MLSPGNISSLPGEPIARTVLPAREALAPMCTNQYYSEPRLFTDYTRTLSRWRVVILSCGVAGALVSFSLTLPVLPLYLARTSLDIQTINGDFLNMRNVAPVGDDASSSTEAYVQTEIKLLQSRTVLDRTVAEMKARPHPPTIDRDDLLSQWEKALHLSHVGSLSYYALVDDAARRVKIKAMGATQVVEVTCNSWDPQFSAAFCNEITNQFKTIDLETRSAEAQKTSDFLTRQVADVRQKAEESEQKLEAATGGDGLALSQESNNIGEDHLRQLEGEIVRAEADRIQKESALHIAMSAAPDAIPTALESPVYHDYEQKLAGLNAQVAALMPPLTEEHPKIIHLRSEIRDVQADLARERVDTLQRLQNEYNAARHYENHLDAAYAAAQSSVSSEMSKTERVNLLRREVDSETQLYQTLLQRAKEAGFAAAMETTTMRVVDTAVTPDSPFSPHRGVAALTGLTLGLLLGFAFAFYKTRTSRVLLLPGEAGRAFNVYELGTIPTAALVSNHDLLSFLRNRLGSETTAAEGQPTAIVPWRETVSLFTEAFRNVTHSIWLTVARANGEIRRIGVHLTSAAGYHERRSRIYTIASPNSGEGKSMVTANLGIAFSKSNLKVVIVDADMRSPTQHRKFGVENKRGLRNILREEIDVTAAALDTICKRTLVPNLFLIPAGDGAESSVELLHSRAAATLLKRLSAEFDLVLIDTPPMLHMADARILSAQSDGVILVFRSGVTHREHAAQACDRFRNDRVPVIGTILNDFNASRTGQGDYYSSYFDYVRHTSAGTDAPA